MAIIMFLVHRPHPFFGEYEISEIHGENSRIRFFEIAGYG